MFKGGSSVESSGRSIKTTELHDKPEQDILMSSICLMDSHYL